MNKRTGILFSKAKAGDVEAFEELIEPYELSVFNAALKLVRNQEKAGTLAQEVFLRLFRTMQSIEDAPLISYNIYRIVSNICKNGMEGWTESYLCNRKQEYYSKMVK